MNIRADRHLYGHLNIPLVRRPPLMLVSLRNFNLIINLPLYLPPNDQLRRADFIYGTVLYQNKQICIPIPRTRIQINYISNHQQLESQIPLNFMLNNKKIFHRYTFFSKNKSVSIHIGGISIFNYLLRVKPILYQLYPYLPSRSCKQKDYT